MPDEKSPDAKLLKTTLGDVRKGKVRNFAILATGSEVLGLILSKLAIGDGTLIEAKKAAKAKKVFTGVATGKGADVTFFSTAAITIKPAALKAWIGDTTGSKISPAFKTVADLATIGKATGGDTAKPAAKGATDTGKDAKANDKQADAKTQASRKKELVTALSKLIKARPDSLRASAKATAFAKGAKASIDKGDFDLAEKALKALDKATRTVPKANAKSPT